MAGRQAFKDERAKHLEAIGQAPLPLPSQRRADPIPYTDDLPAEAVDLGACGLSETEIAAHWGIDAATLIGWSETHRALKTALSRARVGAEAWWEEKARRALELRDNRFPAGAWAMVMKARFPAYRERNEINVNITTANLVLIDIRTPDLPSQQMVSAPNPLIEHAPDGSQHGLTAGHEVDKASLRHVGPGSVDEGRDDDPGGAGGVGAKPGGGGR